MLVVVSNKERKSNSGESERKEKVLLVVVTPGDPGSQPRTLSRRLDEIDDQIAMKKCESFLIGLRAVVSVACHPRLNHKLTLSVTAQIVRKALLCAVLNIAIGTR